jgi:hypothetical protein
MALDDLQHPDCRACEERKRLSLGQMAEIRHLREALAEDRSKWTFSTLLAVGDALLTDLYPAGVPLLSEGEDPGPRLVRAVRDCREAMASTSSRSDEGEGG